MGPTKEELEKYFKNNRKYFDELAKHYKESDPGYYKEYIAPFYSGTYSGKTGNKKASRTIALAVLIAVFAIGLVTAFLTHKKGNRSIISEEQLNDLIENTKVQRDTALNYKPDLSGLKDSLDALGEMLNFNHGEFLFKIKKFDEAEDYLEKVSEKCPKYREAQDILKEIRKNKKGKK